MEQNYMALSYLLQGRDKQQRAYAYLRQIGIMDKLQRYRPTLVGTIPIGLDREDSDLDIICQADDMEDFYQEVQTHLGGYEHFTIRHSIVNGIPRVVANFHQGEFPVEIFGQPLPIEQQNGYRHMLIEARILQLGGEEVRRALQQLRAQGYKTEPAFAAYLQLAGNPYDALLKLEQLSDSELLEFLAEVKIK